MVEAISESKQSNGPVAGGGNGNPPPPDQAATSPPQSPPATDTIVASFKIGDQDGCGRRIEDIYFKRASYVIYCTTHDSEKQVLVQYADDHTTADNQIAAVAEIIPLRNRLQALLPQLKIKARYYEIIAEAFRLGLENKTDVAKQTLEGCIQEVQDIRGSTGRNIYINQAGPYAAWAAVALFLASAAFLYFSGAPFTKAWSPLAHLLMAAGAGSLGALLSIAISVRARTVAIDGDEKSITIDAALRILIGIVSAGALYLILGTGVLAQLKVGELSFAPGAIAWQLALLLGFAAGFLERLVPDLLEKKVK